MATKRSDKYLLQQNHDHATAGQPHKKTTSSKKHAKKGKKSKHRTTGESDDDDSDADPRPLHHVSTFTELPEGASLSDCDDSNPADADDPHRALDINLDMYVIRLLVVCSDIPVSTNRPDTFTAPVHCTAPKYCRSEATRSRCPTPV